MTNKLYSSTKERLLDYGLFPAAVIERVARIAEQQATTSDIKAFFLRIGMGMPKVYSSKDHGDVPYVDIAARQNPSKGTLVVHLPMGNPLDQNQLYQVGIVAASHPEYRLIAFGNPSGKEYRFKRQNLTLIKRCKIGFTKNRFPLVAAELEYLESQVQHNVWHIGYSYGALKATIAVEHSRNDMVNGVLLIDPVARPRGILQLIRDFRSTFDSLNGYVDRTQDTLFLEARREAASTDHYNEGLIRQINIAIAFMLSRTDFITQLSRVISIKKLKKAVVVWGSKSELGDDEYMKSQLKTLESQTKIVTSVRLKNETHAFANDIYLQAALIRTALET